MPRVRRDAGTTLIEVLVVMVVLLVGILVIVQVFPKGFQILVLSRNASVATALSRDEIERLKSRPDQLPESIVALDIDGNVDVGRVPTDLGLAGDQVLEDGTLRNAGGSRGDWMRFSGANVTRHVIGEGRRVPAPRQVGQAGQQAFYGGLLVLQFNPVDTFTGTGIRAYGNDFNVRFGEWDSNENRGEYDAFLWNPSQATLSVPTGRSPRQYRVSFTAYIQGDGGYDRRDFLGLTFNVAGNATVPTGDNPYPLASVTLADLIAQNNSDGRYDGVTLGSVEGESLRVQRFYLQVPAINTWSTDDVYECKVLTPELGVILFHPNAHVATVPRPDGSEPLSARVDYDVFDWRVIREEFRFAYGLSAQHRLALGGLKVRGLQGPDGRQLVGIQNLEGPSATAALSATGNDRADHLVLMDLDTGGVFLEQESGQPSNTALAIVRVDKTSGLVTLRDVDNDPSNGTTVHLRLPDGTVLTNVQIDNRAIRALYMTRNEYAVQVLKSPSLYTSSLARPGYAQYYVGNSSALGGLATRIYFPASDAGRKVSFGEIVYRVAGGDYPASIVSQDFVIRPPSGDPLGLPYIDIREVVPDAARIDVREYGYGARDVKGASVAVRTLWNPDFFRLSNDGAANVGRIDRWMRGYRRSTNETYLEQGALPK